ncbi:MAG TPA: hypothetical protein IAB01_03375 [Candidatus Avidesulfovibrio excrementigallinarum]|nr:hypothetical protein [Candidatus Avidesulfovibrio excrementigallinarum]
MNKSDTARMPQNQHEEIIELIEIVREEETPDADSELGQPVDIIELSDAIEEPVSQEQRPQFGFGREHAGSGQDTAPAAKEDAAVQPCDTPSDDTAADAQAEESGAVAAAGAAADAADAADAAASGIASVPFAAETVACAAVEPQACADPETAALRERVRALEEQLAQASMDNDALHLRLEKLERRVAESLERNEQALALLDERTAALEAVPQISLDSVQTAMDSLSGQLNASLEAMQSHLEAVQNELYAEKTLATLVDRLEPAIDKAAAQAAARIIREEIARIMNQA